MEKYTEELARSVDNISLFQAGNIALASHFNKKTQNEYNLCHTA